MSTLSMLLHSAGVYLRGAIFSGGNVWEGMVPGVISYCRRWSWWWWWWWWWCREKKQEFASLKAQSEDCFCFTSHAGFEVVRYISDHGLHVNLANSYNIGKCCCYLVLTRLISRRRIHLLQNLLSRFTCRLRNSGQCICFGSMCCVCYLQCCEKCMISVATVAAIAVQLSASIGIDL